jgi:hypothetical protein
MITLLYRLIHYEPSQDHEDNVKRSFYFICALLSTLPIGLVYLIFLVLDNNHIAIELIFIVIEILIIGLIYFFTVFRMSKRFIESNEGRRYYKFGRFTNFLKPLIILGMFAIVILLGRSMSMFFVN